MKVVIPIPVRLEQPSTAEALVSLRRCLNSIEVAIHCLWEETKKFHVSVVVVDDYSRHKISLPDQYTVAKNARSPGQAGALNTIVRSMDADVFVFTDADCIVGRNWLTVLLGALRGPEIDGVAGPNWILQEPKGFWQSHLAAQESKLTQFNFGRYVRARRCFRIDTRNLALRGSLLRKRFPQGLFGEDQGASVSNHTSHHLRRYRDINLAFAPDALVYHDTPKGLVSEIRRYYGWGRDGDYQTIYKLDGASLWSSFLRHHFYRHFIAPWLRGGVACHYLVCTNGAFWFGIVMAVVKSLGRR